MLSPGNGALRLVKGAQAMALGYDANGNMTSRARAGEGQVLTYDAENRLVKVEKSGATLAEFVYGPAGERVKGVVNGVTTVYIGNHYEVQGGTIRKYYYAGPQRVAMREGNTLYWLLTDHLGSTAITANGVDGQWVGEVRYKAWGEDRYTDGTTPTTYRYTGQRAEAGIGLYYYNARWYDPALGRFIQADTIVPSPGEPQSQNRYSYVLNNPVRHIDPTGHQPTDDPVPDDTPERDDPGAAAYREQQLAIYYATALRRTVAEHRRAAIEKMEFTEEEILVLAHMMWGEEGALGDEGMIAAGWVALNRLLDQKTWGYEDLVEAVSAPGQFYGYLQRSLPEEGSDEWGVYQRAIDLATQLVQGLHDDPTLGAQYFGNSSPANDTAWIGERAKALYKLDPVKYSYLTITGSGGGDPMYIFHYDYTDASLGDLY